MSHAPTERGSTATEQPMARHASIELRHLRYFLSVADVGSFRKAAARLGVRPSSVSRRIRDLESLLGTALFIRHPGGVNLNRAGQRLCWRTRSIMRQLADTAADVITVQPKKSESRSRTLCAGSASTAIALTACVACGAFEGNFDLRRKADNEKF